MKRFTIILFSVVALIFTGCDDFLDRPSKTTMNDGNYWTNENNVRLFANGFYPSYFIGYNYSWTTNYAPVRGLTFNDDLTSTGTQRAFETQAPSSRYSTSEGTTWLSQYWGPTWNFALVRKSNLFLERIEMMKEEGNLTEEAYKHWSAVARFFRAFEYSRLVSVFGDVPYFDRTIGDSELDILYKDRDPRETVMDNVYADFEYVMQNMRVDDGNPQFLNRYTAAGFISRFMLFEGTWQKYHESNNQLAQKYLELAVDAGDFVIQSGKYSFGSDFRSLFGSMDLKGNPEVLMYRHYDDALGITHACASYSNLTEGQSYGANLGFIKSFICKDGKPYKLSDVENAEDLSIGNLVATRDPRFEASFWDAPMKESATMLYQTKFIDREGPTYKGGAYPPQYGSVTNTNDYPVMRYAEVVLNWVEAKAEIATLGGPAVTQSDIDASINAIRNRPLDDAAIAKGIEKTAPLMLSALPDDPDREADVPALIWEIRRERRMEFFFEHTRLLDIKRWKRIEYMDGNENPDLLLGPWVDFPAEYPEWLEPAKEGVLKVQKEDGTVVTYNGSNASEMVGFYIPENIRNRDAYTERVYLAPLGNAQISEYIDKGYTLTQNPGWN
jgi:hypothetical protein